MYKEFIETLEKDLRRESNLSFIFEDINLEYETKMIEIFNKSIQDEIYSALVYSIFAEKIIGSGANYIKKELQEHSTDEFNHYNKLIKYAGSHGLINKIQFTVPVISDLPEYKDEIVQYVQDLEIKAARDYKEYSKIADKEGDTETRMFFETLMQEELKHYDDIACIKTQRTINGI